VNRQQQRPKGKSGLACSLLNPPQQHATKTAQQPELPVKQLRPNHAEVLIASENIGLKRKPKPDSKVRERNGLTRRDIAVLLTKYPTTGKNISASERALLIDFGQNNITIDQAAARMKTDRIGLDVLVNQLDREVCLLALWERRIKARQGKFINRDLHGYEWEQQQCEDMQDVELGSGDLHVSNPKVRVRKPKQSGVPYGFRTRTRTDFDTKPTRRIGGDIDDPDRTGGEHSGSDDYGEDSGA
jgi:hypothetical protein